MNRKQLLAHLVKAHLGAMDGISQATLAGAPTATLLALHAVAIPLKPHRHPRPAAAKAAARPRPAKARRPTKPVCVHQFRTKLCWDCPRREP